MNRVLLIGAGAAASVFARKYAQNPSMFSHLHIASRTVSKCETLQKSCPEKISISQLDADHVGSVIDCIESVNPDLVVNLALPFQDLTIMEACLQTKVHYLDTANYEHPDMPGFEYRLQWEYHDRFKEAGIMGVLGCGFDPGVTNAYTAYAAKHLFDRIDTLDIVDCNGGDHQQSFATNFNPEVNIREITLPAKFWQDQQWVTQDALTEHRGLEFPQIGLKNAYLMYHEELESIVKHIPSIQRARFWMTFGESYLTHLNVLTELGLTRIDPIDVQGQQVIPLQVVKALLPDPSSLAVNYTGKTCIGCYLSGEKDGEPQHVFIYNISDHAECYKDVDAQAISFTTGVPALAGAQLMIDKIWSHSGIFNVEQLDCDSFLDRCSQLGLPYVIQHRDHSFDDTRVLL